MMQPHKLSDSELITSIALWLIFGIAGIITILGLKHMMLSLGIVVVSLIIATILYNFAKPPNHSKSLPSEDTPPDLSHNASGKE